MVTRTVICVSASEAAKLAAESSWSSGEADSIIKKASTFSTSTNSSDNKNNDNGGGSKRALPSEDIIGGNEIKKRLKKADGRLSDVPRQQPIPKTKGHIEEGSPKYAGVSPEKSSKWSAWRAKIEGKKRHIGIQENEDEEDVAINYARVAALNHGGQEALDNVAREQNSLGSEIMMNYCAGGKKLLALPPGTSISYMNAFGRMEEGGAKDSISYEEAVMKHQRINAFAMDETPGSKPAIIMDLSDVPPQLPILRSGGQNEEGSSKYSGVYFIKETNKWRARIMIDGEQHHIGYYSYENEEEAAIDYARAVFKYKGQEALNNLREQTLSAPSIDLSDVPPQLPIPKSKGRVKEGASKFTGVTFIKRTKKWMAQVTFEGKQRCIGYYDDEEEAAIDYARAVFKYQGQDALDKARERKEAALSTNGSDGGIDGGKRCDLPSGISIIGRGVKKRHEKADRFGLDLSDVPPQLPIPKNKGRIKEGSSKYAGVTFHKSKNKWQAEIRIEGKQRYIGSYENEEEAAVDYARALFKYKGQEALDKAREQSSSGPEFDLRDVPPQLPIPKKGIIKEGTSKYIGVYCSESKNKWKTEINIDGKRHHIGYYDTEEEAAIDYSRALFKYHGYARSLNEVTNPPPARYTNSNEDEKRNKWKAHIMFAGKQHQIGPYENEKGAAIYHARAAFERWRQEAQDEVGKRNSLHRTIPVNATSVAAESWSSAQASNISISPIALRSMAGDPLSKGNNNDNQGEKKRVLPSGGAIISGEEIKKRQRTDRFVLDLSDVPPQLPILRSKGHMKEGFSKYKGVTFHKSKNKWAATIMIDGKQHCIGFYEIEEEAAVDYARAVFKYKMQGELDSGSAIDLSDVPPQPLIRKSKWFGGSKYTGVSFHKPRNKWLVRISIDGEQHHIGYYEKEEEAAADYARAVFKYKGQETLDKARERKSAGMSIDLSDVHPQLPIPFVPNDTQASPNTSILRDHPVSQADFHEKQSSFETTKSSVRNQVLCDQSITHPTTLSISSDEKFFDPVHIFLRSACIEVFVANDHNPGRGAKPQQLGQVGLRCAYCKHVHKSQRAKQAVSYPSKIINIFESVRNFQRTHFEACTYIPDELKERYKYKKLTREEHRKIEQKYIKAYYAEAACEIGLVDTPNGIIFGAPPNLSGKPSQKLLAIMKLAENPAALAHLEELIFPKVKVDQRLENLKLSHLCSETTRQVIALCRQQKTVFVHPSDFPTTSDFRFVLFHQFGPCRPPITALNRRKRCKSRPEKWDTLSGLCCCYCARAHPGRGIYKGMYFPLDLESLNDSSLSHNLKNHLMTCQHTPFEIKEALDELQRLAAEIGVKTKRGSKQMFFQKLWERMANYYPAR